MKQGQKNTQPKAALLRSVSRVDAPVKNSLCCAAAGITALPSSTAEALIPHEKLRGAAHTEATLIAQNCPPAQPVEGYKPLLRDRDASKQTAAKAAQIEEEE
jgi:Fe-S oxidoreductase